MILVSLSILLLMPSFRIEVMGTARRTEHFGMAIALLHVFMVILSYLCKRALIKVLVFMVIRLD